MKRVKPLVYNQPSLPAIRVCSECHLAHPSAMSCNKYKQLVRPKKGQLGPKMQRLVLKNMLTKAGLIK